MPFGYVVVHYINPKSYYCDFLVYVPYSLATGRVQRQTGIQNGKLDCNLQHGSYFLFLVSAKAMARESELLRDLLEVCEQRDQLQSMLAKDKARYQKEDAQVEAQMQAKILTVTQ